MFKPGGRTLAAAVVPLVGLMALTACAGDGGDEPADNASAAPDATEPVVVTVWARENDHVIDPQAELFNNSQDAIVIEVTHVPDGDLLSKYATAIRTDDAPDIIDFDIIDAPLLSTQGVLEDLTDRIAGLDTGNVVPAGLAIGQLDGRTYSVPVAIANSQMFWNKDLFAQAGLDPEDMPSSLAEVRAAAEAISALGEGYYGFSTIGGTGGAYTGFPALWASGGTVLTDLGEDQTATFDTPEVREYLGWYQNMWQDGLMPPTDEPNQDPGGVGLQTVAEGKVGIIFAGSWAIASDDAKRFDWGYGPGIPGNDDGSFSAFVGGQNAGITAGSEHVDEAWQFLAWLLTDEEAAQVLSDLGQVPPDLAIAESLAEGDALAQSGIEALKVGQVPASIAYTAVINDANGPWAVASQSVIFQGADIDAALERAQADADQLIADAYSQL